MDKQPHLAVTPSQVHERVIVCGEPDRVDRIARLLDNVEHLGQNREYRLINGLYQGQGITVCSTGIGAPSMTIAVEELKNCGVRKIIRVGSAGALQPHIQLGDVVVVEAAVRDEGGSKAYIKTSYPAYSSCGLVMGMCHYLQHDQQQHNYHCGVVRSHDSFYRDDQEAVCDYWHKMGVLACDMETSALLTVGRLRGMEVASILNNVVLHDQDVQEGINQYVNAEGVMMAGELKAAQAALEALVYSPR